MKCLECGKEFKNGKGLHGHLKAHRMSLEKYYTKHFQRVSLATGEPIVFKDPESYLVSCFNSDEEMRRWFANKEVSSYAKLKLCQILLESYMSSRNLAHTPTEFELMTIPCPTARFIKEAGLTLEKPPLFKWEAAPKVELAESYFVDTREQKPFEMPNAVVTKLDIGDYAAGGRFFDNVFCDRKSVSDFIGTMSGGFERFEREVQRSVETDAFLYVIIEGSREDVRKDCLQFASEKVYSLVFNHARKLIRNYPNRIQFVLAGDRDKAENLTKHVLSAGKAGTQYDYQYIINNHVEPWN